MSDDLTIVIPVFNEEEILPPLFLEINNFLQKSPVPSRVLFVNDGSTDNSLKILQEICRQSLHSTLLSFDRNYGLSVVIKAGFDHCETTLVGYMDADLQTHPSDFLSYFSYFPEYDMVNGIRAKRKDGLVKRISSKIANSYRRLMINDGIEDTCCPLKIIKRSYVLKMPFFIGMHRFLPALVQLQGGRYTGLPFFIILSTVFWRDSSCRLCSRSIFFRSYQVQVGSL